MKAEEFANKQLEKSEVDYGLCPPPTTTEEAFEVLTRHFLGENWYTTLPLSSDQANTEIVYAILKKTQPKNWWQRLFNL